MFLVYDGIVNRENVLETLARFYSEVDEWVSRLICIHSARLLCGRGCAGCCVDGLTVFQVEAENIRRHYAGVLERGTPHAKGACAFLDEAGTCRIYPVRPYVCRTQGLPLRWIDKLSDGRFVELRDICPLNEEGLSVETLPPEECWSIGPFEERLARLQASLDAGPIVRVSLRSLFRPR